MGIVGAGQLAKMMGEVATEVGVEVTVLATSTEDSATANVSHVIVGAPDNEDALIALSRVTDVITFDHELVDLEILQRLEERGVVMRPSAAALRFSVDKAAQRDEFADAGYPLPACVTLHTMADLTILEDWMKERDVAFVVKAARGGYDGRGVLFPNSPDEVLASSRDLLRQGSVVVEERVSLTSEVAQLVVRSLAGDVVTYPLVTTVQSEGMCVEVRYPATIEESLHDEARRLGVAIAHHIGLVGVMAVEFFVTPQGLLINELALRPHNSGHWTIEGTQTSQFANHLRAVTGQSLGDTHATSGAAVMVNVVGAQQPGSLEAARQVPDVYVHDYGKAWRPGRKLGHVTAVGDDASAAHVRAWQSARAYGTLTQEA